MAEVSQFASNAADFHKCLIRNSYYMPALKSKACTLAWMYEVYLGVAWCPKQSELNTLRQLASVPKKDVLIRIFDEAITGTLKRQDIPDELRKPMAITLAHVKDHAPDGDWLLNVIGLVMPGHRSFRKAMLLLDLKRK